MTASEGPRRNSGEPADQGRPDATGSDTDSQFTRSAFRWVELGGKTHVLIGSRVQVEGAPPGGAWREWGAPSEPVGALLIPSVACTSRIKAGRAGPTPMLSVARLFVAYGFLLFANHASIRSRAFTRIVRILKTNKVHPDSGLSAWGLAESGLPKSPETKWVDPADALRTGRRAPPRFPVADLLAGTGTMHLITGLLQNAHWACFGKEKSRFSISPSQTGTVPQTTPLRQFFKEIEE